MSYLNLKARVFVANALRDVQKVYERLAADCSLPRRFVYDFNAEIHMADTLANLFEQEHTAINAENADQEKFKAPIWEAPIWEQLSKAPKT